MSKNTRAPTVSAGSSDPSDCFQLATPMTDRWGGTSDYRRDVLHDLPKTFLHAPW